MCVRVCAHAHVSLTPEFALVPLCSCVRSRSLLKHINYLHMASHTLGEFWHSPCLVNFLRLGLTLAFKGVRLNSFQTSQLVQGLVGQDYQFLSNNLIVVLPILRT